MVVKLDASERSGSHARFMSRVLLLALLYLLCQLVSRLCPSHGCRFSEGRGGANENA